MQSLHDQQPGILERSKNYGATYEAWQYFAKNRAMCLELFNVDPWVKIKRNHDVACSTKFSSIEPLRNGQVSWRGRGGGGRGIKGRSIVGEGIGVDRPVWIRGMGAE